MIYSVALNIPANTPITALASSKLKVTKGFIYQLDIYFPPGPSGLCGVLIRDHVLQLYPFNRGSFFVADDRVISFPESHYVDREPFELFMEGYNTDTLYSHTVEISIGLVSADVFIARYVPQLAAEQLAVVIRSIQSAQEVAESAQRQAMYEQATSVLGTGQ